MMHLTKQHRLAYDRSNFVRIRDAQLHVLPIQKYPGNPVLVPDRPWEEDVHLYGSILHIDGVYKMWYFARTESYAVHSMCYAESEDGIHWVKPELDVIEYKGQKTNIVMSSLTMGKRFGENFSVLYTPWDEGREYKMLYVGKDKDDSALVGKVRSDFYQKLAQEYTDRGDWQMAEKASLRSKRDGAKDRLLSAMYIATSSDGIHWKEGEAPIAPYIDDISHMMYDEKCGLYRLYGRGFTYDAGRCQADRDKALFDGYLGRAVYTSTSPDAINWSEPVLVHSADAFDRPGDEIYSMSVFPWEGCYIGLVQMYHGAPDDMTLDIQLAISNDGVHFERVGDRNPIIPLGEAGEWDRFNTCIADEPVMVDGKLRIYFNGAVFRHLQILGSCDYDGMDTWDRIVRIGFGEAEPDRFACARASFGGGALKTVPMIVEGTTLHLNCDCSWGQIKILVEGAEKQEEIIIAQNGADIPAALPEWAAEEPVQLTFTLKNARLYSFWAD